MFFSRYGNGWSSVAGATWAPCHTVPLPVPTQFGTVSPAGLSVSTASRRPPSGAPTCEQGACPNASSMVVA